MKAPNIDQASCHQGRSQHRRRRLVAHERRSAACSTTRTEKLVMHGQNHHRHELGHHRRAEACVARHEEPDASIASAGLVHHDRGTVKANALTFISANSTLTFRGKVRVHLSSKRRTPSAEKKPPQAAGRSPDRGSAAAGSDRPPLPRARGPVPAVQPMSSKFHLAMLALIGRARSLCAARLLPRRP